MANPTPAWDRVPVFGWFFTAGETPLTGEVRFRLPQRVTSVDGLSIYPKDMLVVAKIGDADDQDATVRSEVRTALRAAYQTSNTMPNVPGTFNGTAWDVWWDARLPAAIFTSFYASDDPNIVEQGYQVMVEESLAGGVGQSYTIQPVLADLDRPIPGVNLGLVAVPPDAPAVPAPIYQKGHPGGVASLDADGLVPLEQLPEGIGGGVDEGAVVDIIEANPQAPADSTVTNAKVASGAGIVLSKTADDTAGAGRLAMTNAERSKLTALPSDAQSAAQVDSRSDMRIAAQKDTANGIAALDSAGKLSSSVLPPLAIGETFTVASQAAMLALTAQRGDLAIRTDLDPDGVFILTADAPGTLSNWVQITAPGAVVTVAGKSGAVSLVKADVGLGNLDNARQVPLVLGRPIIFATAPNTFPTKASYGLTGYTGPWEYEHTKYGTIDDESLPADLGADDIVTDLAP